jgi:hypothetical protein
MLSSACECAITFIFFWLIVDFINVDLCFKDGSDNSFCASSKLIYICVFSSKLRMFYHIYFNNEVTVNVGKYVSRIVSMFISEYTSFDSATVLYPVLCPGYDIHTYISSEAVTTFTDTAYHIKCIVPGTKDIYILILVLFF